MKLVDLRSDLPWNPNGRRWASRRLGDISQFVIHHSATGENKNPLLTVRAFNRGHIQRNGWPRIAYHYVIDSQGTVYWTNRNRDICTHAGLWGTNANSLGVCLIGRLHVNYPTGAHLDALRELRRQISRNRGRNLVSIPHYQVVDTTCPGRHWWEKERAWINDEASIKPGVHLANDGNITEQHLELIRNLPMVKGMVRLDCDWGEPNWWHLAAHLRDDCDVVLRLYYPGRLEANEFLTRAVRKLPPVLAALSPHTCYIEIHNEPNHVRGIEGWGASAEQAVDFAAWYRVVLDGLRAAGFSNLGFPGLAVGEWIHGERTWAEINAGNIKRSDWLGVHCYWQTWAQIYDIRLGENWRWYRERFPKKRIIVTEAANSGCDGEMGPPSPDEQAQQYVQWCELADVHGVTFFILGGAGWDGFQVWPQTIAALEGL